MYAGVKHAIRGLHEIYAKPFNIDVDYPGISESMDMEVSPFGIRSINIEPGYFRTRFIDPNNRSPYVNRIEAYKPTIGAMDNIFTGAIVPCSTCPTLLMMGRSP